jgi:hypothetical protein
MYVVNSEPHSVKRSLAAMCYESNRPIYDSFTVYDIPKFICAYLLTVHNVLNLILITLVNV